MPRGRQGPPALAAEEMQAEPSKKRRPGAPREQAREAQCPGASGFGRGDTEAAAEGPRARAVAGLRERLVLRSRRVPCARTGGGVLRFSVSSLLRPRTTQASIRIGRSHAPIRSGETQALTFLTVTRGQLV